MADEETGTGNELHEITEFIDSMREHINDAQYLDLCTKIKEINERLLRPDVWDNVKRVALCNQDGVFCECEVNRRVNILVNNTILLPRYLRIIAEQAAEIHLSQFT